MVKQCDAMRSGQPIACRNVKRNCVWPKHKWCLNKRAHTHTHTSGCVHIPPAATHLHELTCYLLVLVARICVYASVCLWIDLMFVKFKCNVLALFVDMWELNDKVQNYCCCCIPNIYSAKIAQTEKKNFLMCVYAATAAATHKHFSVH